MKDKLSVRTSFGISYSDSHYINYSIEKTKTSRQTFSLRLTNYFIEKGLFFNNEFSFTKNKNISARFGRNSYFWNSSANYQFFKKQMMLKLSVYDLLNQRQNMVRTIADNYIEDREGMILRRYFLLSIIFKLNKIGK